MSKEGVMDFIEVTFYWAGVFLLIYLVTNWKIGKNKKKGNKNV